MDDDFNTPEAVAVLFELAHRIHAGEKALAAQLRALGGVLGLLQREPQAFLQGREAQSWITEAIAARELARKRKDYAEADRIRGELLAKGHHPRGRGRENHLASEVNRYEIIGRSDGARRAVLVHSLAMDREFWRPVAERLDAAVLLYDCTGHGESAKPPGPYSVEGFADDLARLLDHVGWERTLVAGASMGGCVALAFAARYAKRVSALGLADTTAWYGPDAPRQWEERAQKALEQGLRSLVDFQVTRWFSERFRKDNPEAVQRAVATFLRNDVQAYAASCRMLGAADLRRSLSAVVVPAAVIVGEEDYATPVSMARSLQQGIRGASLKVLTGARHLTALEKPAEVAHELQKVLA